MHELSALCTSPNRVIGQEEHGKYPQSCSNPRVALLIGGERTGSIFLYSFIIEKKLIFQGGGDSELWLLDSLFLAHTSPPLSWRLGFISPLALAWSQLRSISELSANMPNFWLWAFLLHLQDCLQNLRASSVVIGTTLMKVACNR